MARRSSAKKGRWRLAASLLVVLLAFSFVGIGVWATFTEDVPFAVELRDGDPGLMFKQARA